MLLLVGSNFYVAFSWFHVYVNFIWFQYLCYFHLALGFMLLSVDSSFYLPFSWFQFLCYFQLILVSTLLSAGYGAYFYILLVRVATFIFCWLQCLHYFYLVLVSVLLSFDSSFSWCQFLTYF